MIFKPKRKGIPPIASVKPSVKPTAVAGLLGINKCIAETPTPVRDCIRAIPTSKRLRLFCEKNKHIMDKLKAVVEYFSQPIESAIKAPASLPIPVAIPIHNKIVYCPLFNI